MTDVNKAHSVEHGIIVDENLGGPFYTGGTASPIGLDLPEKTFYLQTVAGGVLLWRKFNTGVNDWRQLSAQDIPFSDTGSTYKSASNTVAKALEELRTTRIIKPQVVNTTLNGTFNILKDTFSFIDVHGTATGFDLELPNATLLADGRSFEIINDSDEIISVEDFDGNNLLNLNPEDKATFLLEHNTSTAGIWIFDVTSSTATGIISEVVTSNVEFTTTSTTDVIITGFTVTPVAGRYSVFYSAEVEITQQNKISESVVYVGGVAEENTRRKLQGVGNNFESGVATIGEISVNGSQAVDIRVNISASSVKVRSRSFILIRLGGV